MRSPSPDPNADSLSDTGEPSSTSEPSPTTSEPSPPVRHKRATATTAARAAPGRQGQQGLRHGDYNGPGHDGRPLATKLSVDHAHTTAAESGLNSAENGSALAEQSSALLANVPNKQTATRQDAAQQTVTSSERPVPDRHDASVQSEGAVLPDTDRQPRTAAPTGERGTQTPIGHASPRPLQKAPPGRDPQWSPPHAAHEAESHSRAQADSYSFGHARAGQLQGNWQSPPTQWAGAAVDPFSYRDSLAAQGDAHSILTSPAPDQQVAEHTQRPAQRLFCSPPPDGEFQQLAMQPPEHNPSEQQPAASNSQAQQQDTKVHRSAAEDTKAMLEGYQDADRPPVGMSNNPAEASPSAAPAGVATRPAQDTVGTAVTSSGNTIGPATAPPTAAPTQAQAGLGSAWPGMPAALPHMAEPSLQPGGSQPRRAHVHAQLPSHMPWVPQQQGPPLLGEGYAFMQSLPTAVTAQPAVLHADPREVHRGSGAGQRSAAAGAPVGVMQRQQGLPGMYGHPRYMYPGASLLDWSTQILYPASQNVWNHDGVANAHVLQ